MQGGAQNLERVPPPRGAPPGLPKFRASGQAIDSKDQVWSQLPLVMCKACDAALTVCG